MKINKERLLSSITYSNGFEISGENYGDDYKDKSGYSVSSAGDFNGDGIEDVVIAAPGINRCYIIFGKKGGYSDTDMNQLLSSDDAFYIYGSSCWSVSGAGDVNSDGYDDIIVGDPNSGSINEGKAYVIYGNNSSSNMHASNRGFSITGVNVGGQVGYSVSGAGDFNGDGYDDIIVGAPYASYNGQAGTTYIIYGAASGVDINLGSLTVDKGFILEGFTSEDNSGFSVSGIGDFNGDGYDDIIVGSPGLNRDSNNNAGGAFIVYGNLTSTNFNLQEIFDENSRGFFILGENGLSKAGYSVSGGGNFNGDDYPDLVISAVNAEDYAGACYILYGGSNNNNVDLLNFHLGQGIKIIGKNSGLGNGDVIGQSVSLVGDFNTDGYDDLIIGAPYETDSANYLGVSYIILGGISNSVDLGDYSSNDYIKISGTHTYGYSGFSVATGDFNGDNIKDILVGAPYATNQGWNNFRGVGVTRFILGVSSTSAPTFSPTDVPTLSPTSALTFSDSVAKNIDLGSVYSTITGANENDNVGLSVSSVGDINGDGYADIILSSIYESSFAGKVYIIFGQSVKVSNLNIGTILETQGFSITGGSSYDYFGTTLSAAGDVNGDGYDDIIVGAPSSSSGDGKVYVIFGKASGFSDVNVNALSSTERFSIYGAQDSRCGSSVSSAGDVNGDGYDDIIIGASDSAKVYVIFGKASGFSSIYLDSLSSSDGYIISGDDIGFAVSGAGDFNGDGYADVIIGAGSSSPKSNKEGTSYILYGKASGFSNVDLSSITMDQGFYIVGDNVNDQSGRTVSSLDDFNGDGYADIIIGAPFALSNTGKSYIIYGNKTISSNIDLSSINATHGMEIIGALSNGNLGSSLSGAGDVNGDGYADIIIGANSASPKSFHEGVSYVIFGNSEKNSQLSLGSLKEPQGYRLTGDSYNDVSGNDVSGGGDLNNDGYDDVIISAPFVDIGSNDNVGKVYIVYGSASYISREINSGGVYVGTSFNEDFIIDSSSDISITGGGGNDQFTVKPNSNTQTTITDFDKDNEKIDLSFFDNINTIDDFTITAGSAMINLEDDQTIRLLNLQPSDITADNFILSESMNDDDDETVVNISPLIAYGILAGVGLAVLGCSGFAAYKCCCSGSNKGTVAPTYEMT